MLIHSKLYDRLKFLAQIGLPAVGSLYFALAGIWGLSSAEQVLGTIVAIDTFLGVILQISTTTYNNSDAKFDGTMIVSEGEAKTLVTMELNKHPNELLGVDQVTFKVNSPTVKRIPEG